MKQAFRLLPLFLLALAIGASPARAVVGRTDRIRFSGRDYVRLNDWARANEFTIRWLDRDRTVQLSNRWTRLTFIANSKEAQINGVGVWLAFPVLLRSGSAYISQPDLDVTLSPVLSPPANSPGVKIKTICLDPGHGGNDPGFEVGRNQEKKYTLLLAQEVRDQLKTAGFNVVLTRTTDTRIELPSRPAVAKLRKADLFVSLHFNSTETARNEVKGLEVYALTPAGANSTNARGEGNTAWVTGNQNDRKNILLAYQIHRALVKKLPVEDRGVRRARWRVLCESQIPAILVEGGFLSHPAEGKKIIDPAYRKQMAQAIVEGIVAYRKSVKG